MQERLESVRREKEKKQADKRRRANFVRKRPVRNLLIALVKGADLHIQKINNEHSASMAADNDDERFAPDDYTDDSFDDNGLTAETRAMMEA